MNMRSKIIITATVLGAFSLFPFAAHSKEGVNPSTGEKYSQCVAIRMKEINLGHLEKNPDKHATTIPEGWTVVGGTGGEGHPKLLLCR